MTASRFSSDQEQPRIIGYALDFRVKETSSRVLAEALSMAPGTIWDCMWTWETRVHPSCTFIIILYNLSKGYQNVGRALKKINSYGTTSMM